MTKKQLANRVELDGEEYALLTYIKDGKFEDKPGRFYKTYVNKRDLKGRDIVIVENLIEKRVVDEYKSDPNSLNSHSDGELSVTYIGLMALSDTYFYDHAVVIDGHDYEKPKEPKEEHYHIGSLLEFDDGNFGFWVRSVYNYPYQCLYERKCFTVSVGFQHQFLVKVPIGFNPQAVHAFAEKLLNIETRIRQELDDMEIENVWNS